MCNKDSASNIQPTSYEPTTGYSSTSVEYFNKSWKVRSIGCLCMSKALLLLRKSSSGFCIRVALNFNPLWVHSWAFMLLYKLQGVSGEKTNILGRDIFRSLCRRIENIHTKVLGTELQLFEPRGLPPLYFCLWGSMMSKVYKRMVDTADELFARILDVAGCIKKREDRLRRTTRHLRTQIAKFF